MHARVLRGFQTRGTTVSKGEIDDYLSQLEEPQRGTLTTLRHSILEVIPTAEQCISYGCRPFGCRARSSRALERSSTT